MIYLTFTLCTAFWRLLFMQTILSNSSWVDFLTTLSVISQNFIHIISPLEMWEIITTSTPWWTPSLSLIGIDKLWYQKTVLSTFLMGNLMMLLSRKLCTFLLRYLKTTSLTQPITINFIFNTITTLEVILLPGSILKHTKAYISLTNLTSSLCSSSRASSLKCFLWFFIYNYKFSSPLLYSIFDLSLPSTEVVPAQLSVGTSPSAVGLIKSIKK